MAAYTNEEWVEALRGPEREVALAELRAVLVRGLHAALARRVPGGAEALVEDFVQEALVKVLARLDQFRGESRFTTWAQKIAVHEAFSELRRKRWHDVSLDGLRDRAAADGQAAYTPAVLSDERPGPEERVEQRMLTAQVAQAIEQALTERQREALTRIAQGRPVEEVAAALGTNRNALYKLVHDARKRLRQALERQGISVEEVLQQL